MKKIIFLIAILLFSSGFTNSKRVEALIEKEVTSVFGIETYTKNTLAVLPEINETLAIKITNTNFFEIINEKEVKGYYYYGQAYGKADYFDFIVIFDKNLIVSKILFFCFSVNQ